MKKTVLALMIAGLAQIGGISATDAASSTTDRKLPDFRRKAASSLVMPLPGDAGRSALQAPRAGNVPALDRRWNGSYGERGFYHRHLMPRLTGQLGGLGPLNWAGLRGDHVTDHQFREEFSVTVGRLMRGGAEKALKDWVLEASGLAGVEVGLKKLVPEVGSSPSRSPSRRTHMRWKFRLSRMVPRVELRLDSRLTAVRFRVAADGSAGVSFHTSRGGSRGFEVKYDARHGSYHVDAHVRF